MPIAETELDKPANKHLVRPAAESVFRALQLWRQTPESQEWWWLIIEHGERRYTALRFENLRETLAKQTISMTTRLSELPARRKNPADWEHPFPGVVTPVVVEQDAIGTARALQMVRESPGHVLVVLKEGRVRGILSDSQRTFAFADKLLLDMLDQFENESSSETVILNQPPEIPPTPPET
jgi:hypothetical protein